MSKRSCVRTPFSKQRFNGFQTLLKSAGHYYYFIFPWIWEILNWKKSLLVWFVILRLFVKSLTADKSIPVAIWTLWHKFKRLYLLNKKHFLNFLLQFWNVPEISNILNIKLSILAYLFPKLYIPIELIT